MRKVKTIDLPYSAERIWNLMPTVCKSVGWTLTKTDKSSGRSEAKIGASIFTWGEKFEIWTTKTSSNTSRLRIEGRTRQLFDWGKTSRDINNFVRELQARAGAAKPARLNRAIKR